MDGTKIVPKLKALADAYRPLFMAVEKSGQQAVIIDQLRACNLTIRSVTPGRGGSTMAAKEVVSIPAQVKYESGQVWHPKSAPWVGTLESELLAFPRGRYDDQVDALSYLVLQANRYDRSSPEPTEEERQALAKQRQDEHFRRMMWAGVEF
jgi:predicted phage terminase large subunit-like protein